MTLTARQRSRPARGRTTLLAILAAATVAGAPALAFECGKAKSKVERAICADPATKASDDALNDAFATLRGRIDAPQRTALLANQRRWLKKRDGACISETPPNGASACLRGENETRIRALAGRPDAGPGLGDALVPVFVERVGTKKTYEVSLMLYRYAGPPSPAGTRLNALTDAEIARAPTRTDDDSGTFTFSSDRQARITYASDRLLSVLVTGYEFSGGAHGQSTSSAVNLDMRAGRELAIGDLLAAKELAQVQGWCRTDIAAELKTRIRDSGEDPDKDADAKASLADLVKQAAEPIDKTVADMTSWSFGGEAATITFVSDVIGPHVLGEFTCTLPYGKLRPVAKASFPLP